MSDIADLDRVKEMVKQRTGYAVSVTPSTSIQSHAAMQSATRDVPVHMVLINPKCEKFGNYLVAAQCAMLLIKWASPRRISDFTVSDQNKASIEAPLHDEDVSQRIAASGSSAVCQPDCLWSAASTHFCPDGTASHGVVPRKMSGVEGRARDRVGQLLIRSNRHLRLLACDRPSCCRRPTTIPGAIPRCRWP